MTTNGGSSPIFENVTNVLSVYPHQYGLLKYEAIDRKIEYTTGKVDV